MKRQSNGVQDYKRGRGTLRNIINCQYSLLVSTATGFASSVYFSMVGPRNVVSISGIVVTFTAVCPYYFNIEKQCIDNCSYSQRSPPSTSCYIRFPRGVSSKVAQTSTDVDEVHCIHHAM